MRHAQSRRPPSAARRGAALAAAVAATAFSATAAWAECGCTGMTVSHANDVTICSNNDLNFQECQKVETHGQGACANHTYSYTCPTGVNSAALNTQKVGFQADAVVTGSADQCTSGQGLQLTITSDRNVQKPKVHATPAGDLDIGGSTVRFRNNPRLDVPDVGTMAGQRTLLGADAYTDRGANDLLIEQTQDHIKWWDNTDQEKEEAEENATWKYRFLSYVQGTQGETSCACVFNVDVNWPANRNAVTTWTKDNDSSTRCNLQ